MLIAAPTHIVAIPRVAHDAMLMRLTFQVHASWACIWFCKPAHALSSSSPNRYLALRCTRHPAGPLDVNTFDWALVFCPIQQVTQALIVDRHASPHAVIEEEVSMNSLPCLPIWLWHSITHPRPFRPRLLY